MLNITQPNRLAKSKGIHFSDFEKLTRLYEEFKKHDYEIKSVTVHDIVNNGTKFEKSPTNSNQSLMRLSTKDMNVIRIKAECVRNNFRIVSTYGSDWWTKDINFGKAKFEDWTLIRQDEHLLDDDGYHVW